MVFRIYVEKKPGLDFEAQSLLNELRQLPQVENLRGLRLLNRYDVEGISQELFDRAVPTVFSEPQTDRICFELPAGDHIFAVEYLPGQFDQRADSAAQCIQLISGQERPLVRTARVYLPAGDLSQAELAALRHYLINPVESRLADLAPFQTLAARYPQPQPIPVLAGFSAADEAGLAAYISDYGLAMDLADLVCCQQYFRSEHRDPSLTELRVLDTYWSDHCRHTTFATTLDQVEIADDKAATAYQRYLAARQELGRDKPINLMDLATCGARYLKFQGVLRDVDESPEINACTVRVPVDHAGETEDWLLLFKNETHNHPTEIEPFGGAATCLGGAIRDPLSGRAYVYQAMRLTGAADPLAPLSATLPGKLPQRKLTTTAAAGYSSYGNQIGLATGLVDELYHPGYAAKRMEVGAVVGAAPVKNVRREVPQPGDLVLLVGGRTGRDGCGGATGSSKAHDIHSLETCGAEVQKGNAPEERKLQRLFRNPQASRLIKRCNDFGAGGVSVAIGELADGLAIDLDQVPKKYEGLDGTELAISESQERMALVTAAADAEQLIALAAEENLQATVVAKVTAEPRLTMDWQGRRIVDLSRAFLDTNGGEKHARARIAARPQPQAAETPADLAGGLRQVAASLDFCSRRGLAERFDSTVGAGSVLMPFGGRTQRTPAQAMAAKLPVPLGATTTCSVMSWGFDPWLSAADPFTGSYLAVVSSLAKLVATGAPLERAYLSFQEYFPKLGADPERWGLPLAALLGAFAAQLDLGVAAIGGKDSMSGSFGQLDVPPTLISFAITVADSTTLVGPEFKQAGSRVALLLPQTLDNGLPEPDSLRQIMTTVSDLAAGGRLRACWSLGRGGLAEAALKMGVGNELGLRFEDQLSLAEIFAPINCGFMLELAAEENIGRTVGHTTAEATISHRGHSVDLAQLAALWEGYLEPVFPLDAPVTAGAEQEIPTLSYSVDRWPRPAQRCAQPRFLLPVFPGTNCEVDSANAIERAGGRAELVVVQNLTPSQVVDSVRRFAAAISRSQVIFIPGGFSGGDEPDGSGKFITAFFRNPLIAAEIADLLQRRDGLIAGICNGFQALVKLGLVPFGEIREMDADCPTLTFNTIGRHQSRLARARVASTKSPWMARTQVGAIHTLPISHGEGRFLCPQPLLQELAANGQVVSQYVDQQGRPGMSVAANPNGSVWAVEGLCSPDGRVLGKMCHAERISDGLYRNVPGCFELELFESAVDYFR